MEKQRGSQDEKMIKPANKLLNEHEENKDRKSDFHTGKRKLQGLNSAMKRRKTPSMSLLSCRLIFNQCDTEYTTHPLMVEEHKHTHTHTHTHTQTQTHTDTSLEIR